MYVNEGLYYHVVVVIFTFEGLVGERQAAVPTVVDVLQNKSSIVFFLN